jgi:hypothetical protein
VLEAGDTTGEPLEYTYKNAPEGTIVKVLPEHTDPLMTEIVGVLFTVTLLIALLAPTQPWALVPVTVYDALTSGKTVAEPEE